MDNSYYFDTRSLRDHVSALQEERRIVQRLYETVQYVRDSGNPLLRQEYGQVLNYIEELQYYFDRTIDVFENAAFDAAKLSQEISMTVQDETDNLHNEISRQFRI